MPIRHGAPSWRREGPDPSRVSPSRVMTQSPWTSDVLPLGPMRTALTRWTSVWVSPPGASAVAGRSVVGCPGRAVREGHRGRHQAPYGGRQGDADARADGRKLVRFRDPPGWGKSSMLVGPAGIHVSITGTPRRCPRGDHSLAPSSCWRAGIPLPGAVTESSKRSDNTLVRRGSPIGLRALRCGGTSAWFGRLHKGVSFHAPGVPYRDRRCRNRGPGRHRVRLWQQSTRSSVSASCTRRP